MSESTAAEIEPTEEEQEHAETKARLKLLDAIEQQEERCQDALAEWNAAKDHAAGCKKLYDARVVELRRLAAAHKEDLPLFEPITDGSDWESVPLEQVGFLPADLTKLNDGGLHTVGELARYTEDSNELRDLAGIGEVAEARIVEVMDKFWAERGVALNSEASEDETEPTE